MGGTLQTVTDVQALNRYHEALEPKTGQTAYHAAGPHHISKTCMSYQSFQAHANSSINSLCFAGGTDYVLTGGGNDFHIKLHNLEKLETVTFPKQHTNSINALDVSSTNEFFISASNDTIVAQDFVKQTVLRQFYNKPKNSDPQLLSALRDEVLDCKLMNDSLVVTCGVNHHVNVFDLKQAGSKRPVYSVSMGDDNLNSIRCHSQNTKITTGSSNGSVYTLDIRMSQVDADPIGSSIINIGSNEQQTLMLLKNGNLILRDLDLNHTAFSTNIGPVNYKLNAQLHDNFIINGTEHAKVQIWDTKSSSHVRELKLPTPTDTLGRLLNVTAYSSTSNCVVSSSGTGIVHVWNGVF